MQIRLLQWNVWYKENIEKVAATLKEINPDIACLQELSIGYQQDHPDTISYLALQLEDYAYHYKEIEFGNWSQVNAIYSRFPLDNLQSAWINEPNGIGGFEDEYRAYIEASAHIDGKVLQIGTVHMSYTHEFTETERKNQEADKLFELIKDKQNFLLLGDLNVLPGSYTINKLSEKLQNAGPDLSDKSWTTKPFDYEGFKADTLDWRLDYVLKSPDIKVISAEIIKTEVSDHLPILVTIEI